MKSEDLKEIAEDGGILFFIDGLIGWKKPNKEDLERIKIIEKVIYDSNLWET